MGIELVVAALVLLALAGIGAAIARRESLPDGPVEAVPEIPVVAPADADERDQAALEVVRRYQKEVRWRAERTRLRFREVYERSYALACEIAAVYHPESEQPELEATVADIVELNRRITERVSELLRGVALRPLRKVRLGTILRYRERYRRLRDSRFGKIVEESPVLYRTASRLWAAYNATNPYYWGRRVAFTATQEMLLRTLHVQIITIVGEEAMRVYGARAARAEAAPPE